jgi:hypothetical protein
MQGTYEQLRDIAVSQNLTGTPDHGSNGSGD